MKKVLFILSLIPFIAFGQTGEDDYYNLRKGDEFYKQNKRREAEKEYRRASDKKETLKSSFNLGNAIYNQGQYNPERYVDAVEPYQKAISYAQTEAQKANAFYNLGNVYLKQEQVKEAADAYKEALRIDPKHKGAKYNLSYIYKKWKEEKQEQEQQQNQDQNQENNEDQKQNEDQEQQENKDEQEQQNQEEKSQEEKDKEQKEKQEQEQKDQEGKEGDQQQGEENKEEENEDKGEQEGKAKEQMEAREMNKKEALQLLRIMEDEEQKVQDKLRRVTSKPSKSDKDW